MAGEHQKPEDLDAMLNRLRQEHSGKPARSWGSRLERMQPPEDDEGSRFDRGKDRIDE